MLYKDMIYTPFSGASWSNEPRAGRFVCRCMAVSIDAAEKLEMYHALF